jgi:hypothetical protein
VLLLPGKDNMADYPGVIDDEEKLNKPGYIGAMPAPNPAPMPSAATADMPAAMPAPEKGVIPGGPDTYAAPTPKADTNTPPPAPMPASAATLGNSTYAPASVAPPPAPKGVPTAEEYAAAGPHGWRKVLGALAVGAAGYKNPEAGARAEEEVFGKPREQLEKQKTGELAAYNTELNRGIQEREESSKEALQGAQAKEAEARAGATTAGMQDVTVTLPNGQVAKVPAKDAERLFGTELQQQGAGERVGKQQAGATERAEMGNETKKEIQEEKGGQATDIEKLRQQGRESIQSMKGEIEKLKINEQGTKIPPLVGKAYDGYQDSQSRYDVMEQNLDKGKKGDQQAMLSLLANHLGMTMGLAKGARINQAMISEAEASAPWLGRIQARFDNRGYLTGVVLTPEQMDSMVDLARNRVSEDGRKVQAMETYFNSHGNQGGGEKPRVQQNSKGEFRYSTDGGKTWQQGKPPQQ